MDQRYVNSLRAQIEGHERDLAKVIEKASIVGWLNDLVCQRDGISMVLEELRAELRAELGEPDPTKH